MKLAEECKSKIKEEYPYNLMDICKFEQAERTTEIFQECLDILRPKYKLVLEYRFRDKFTLNKTGELLGVTRNRIYQIQMKAIRIIINYLMQREEEEQIRNSMKPEDYPLYVLNLSTRAYNTLSRAGKRKVGDVMNITEEQAVRIRNFGIKSYKSLKQSLNEYQARCEK